MTKTIWLFGTSHSVGACKTKKNGDRVGNFLKKSEHWITHLQNITGYHVLNFSREGIENGEQRWIAEQALQDQWLRENHNPDLVIFECRQNRDVMNFPITRDHLCNGLVKTPVSAEKTELYFDLVKSLEREQWMPSDINERNWWGTSYNPDPQVPYHYRHKKRDYNYYDQTHWDMLENINKITLTDKNETSILHEISRRLLDRKHQELVPWLQLNWLNLDLILELWHLWLAKYQGITFGLNDAVYRDIDQLLMLGVRFGVPVQWVHWDGAVMPINDWYSSKNITTRSITNELETEYPDLWKSWHSECQCGHLGPGPQKIIAEKFAAGLQI